MRVRYDHLPATALPVFIAIFERPWWQLVAGLGMDGGRATFCGHRHDATTKIRDLLPSPAIGCIILVLQDRVVCLMIVYTSLVR